MAEPVHQPELTRDERHLIALLRHGPQSVGVLASARLTMEENFLLQKLSRTALGTNSIHSCEAT